MKKEILTDNGIYEYEKVELYDGRKILDPDVARKNLLDFKKVCDKHKIRYGLMFGTLLGAIREGAFIVHDEDTDVFVLVEDRDKVLNALFDFEELGFKVARFNKRKDLLSLIRDDDYIDMYFYKKFLNKRKIYDNMVDAKYLENRESVNFLGEDFPVPGNPKELLKVIYGEDWETPIKDRKPTNYSYNKIVKKYIKENVTFLYKIYKFLKVTIIGK